MNKCSITFGLIAVLNVIAVTTASKKRVIHTMVIEILHHFFFYTPSRGPIYTGTVNLEQHAQSCVMDLMKIFKISIKLFIQMGTEDFFFLI